MPGGTFDATTNGAKLPPKPIIPSPNDMPLEEILSELGLGPTHIRNILKLPAERPPRAPARRRVLANARASPLRAPGEREAGRGRPETRVPRSTT